MPQIGGVAGGQDAHSLLGDLTASPAAAPDTIEAIHAAVAAALAAGQRYPLLAGGGGELGAHFAGPADDAEEAAPFAKQPAEDAAVAEEAAPPLVLRRDLPLQPPVGPGALPDWAVGRRGEVAGSAIGALGQPVRIETFAAFESVKIQRASESSPFLVIAAPVLGWEAHGNATLGAGSVWISAALLAAGAPASFWVGLRIASGAMSGAITNLGPGAQILAATATMKIELKLAPATPAAGTGPGADARAADVRAPGKASFTFAPGAIAVGDVDAALLTAYGETVRMRHAGKPAAYEPQLASVVVPLEADAEEWNPAAPASTLSTLGGKGKIARAGWFLSLTRGAPNDLGEAIGSGGLALQLDGLGLAFAAQARPVPLGRAWLLAQPGSLALIAVKAAGTGLGGQVGFYPQPGGGRGVGGRASFRFADEFGLTYLSSAAGSEGVFAAAAHDVSLDRPATATGERVPLEDSLGFFALTQTAAETTLLLDGELDGPAATQRVTTLLENALLRLGAPGRFTVRAKLGTGPELVAPSGSAAIVFPLLGLVPTLPDPYAATFVPASHSPRRDTASVSAAGSPPPTVVARLDWNAESEPAELALAFSQPGSPASASEPAAPADPPELLGAVPARAEFAAARVDDESGLLTELCEEVFRGTESVPSPIALLDLSGNADQFGVRLGIARPARGGIAAAAPPHPPAIAGLSFVAPAHTVSVITLPAVQWEPLTIHPAGFFAPITFPNSGGETEVTPRSVRLVPLAPAPALAQMIADYDDAATQAGVVALVTFPFGIRAGAVIAPSSIPGEPGSELDLHRPAFGAAGLEGAKQLRAVAPPREAGSTSFPGATVQLRNALYNGAPVSASPIEPLTKMFNEQFGPEGGGGVPVERFELTGYGETVFSDWKHETDAAAEISQVRFDVLNGRTSVEIVEGRSTLSPYAARVTRAVKMIRDNAGRVRRTEEAWQPQTDGRYRWPHPDVHTHPGIVRGITAIKNIRDTGQRWKQGTTELMAVRFDCLVDLEGVVEGGVEGGVPSYGQLGFVQISKEPEHGISPDEFAALIAAFGPLGGAVDAVVEVGSGGLRTRVTRVGVGATPGTAGPEFAMAAWGSPVLPRGGSWSVLRRGAAQPAPGPVDPTLGVPLIRAGRAGEPPSPGAPYRFADPADLATPGTPAADYALMHATPGQRVIFPRPEVDLVGPRAGQLSSSQPPVLADPFLMATATGPFPPVATAIGFPDADYGLRPLPGGDLALDLAHNDFAVSGGDRLIHANAGSRVFIRYRDESGAPAVVHLELDSSKPVPWAFSVGGVELCLATSQIGEVIRLLGKVDASATQPGRLTGGTVHFGPGLEAVEAFTSFLGSKRLADLPLASRNQPSLEIALKLPVEGIDLGVLEIDDGDVTVGVKIDLANGETTLKFELEVSADAQTPFPPLTASGQMKFEIESSSEGDMFKFTLGLGVGAGTSIGPFEAKAHFYQNDYLVIGSNEIGLGVGVELKAEIDLEVAKAEVDVEALALMIRNECPPDSTWWLVGQLTIGVDVTIAWVVDIDFEYQWQLQTNLDGGPCGPPMV